MPESKERMSRSSSEAAEVSLARVYFGISGRSRANILYCWNFYRRERKNYRLEMHECVESRPNCGAVDFSSVFFPSRHGTWNGGKSGNFLVVIYGTDLDCSNFVTGNEPSSMFDFRRRMRVMNKLKQRRRSVANRKVYETNWHLSQDRG